MDEEHRVKLDLLKEHYLATGRSTAEFLHDLSAIRGADPRFPDVPMGEVVDKLYQKIEGLK